MRQNCLGPYRTLEKGEGEMIKVFGASDDLIEIDGDFREEFQASSDEPNYVAFSNGLLLRVTYNDEGCWEIKVIWSSNIKTEIQPNDGDKNYSDILTMDGDMHWAVCGNQMVRKSIKL